MTNDEPKKARKWTLVFTTDMQGEARTPFVLDGPIINGYEFQVKVIELAPIIKMMESMAEANEKLMIETYCLMTQLKHPKRLENLTKEDGSVAFAYHNAREKLESYESFKRENRLD